MYTYKNFLSVLKECVLTHPDGRIRIDSNYVTINYVDFEATVLFEFYKNGHEIYEIAKALVERSLADIEDVSLLGANVILKRYSDQNIPKVKSDNLMLVGRIGSRICTYGDMLQMGYSNEDEFLIGHAVKTLNETRIKLIKAVDDEVYFLTTKDMAFGSLPILFPEILEGVEQKTKANYLIPISDKGSILISENIYKDEKAKSLIIKKNGYADAVYKIDGGSLIKIEEL